MSREPQSLLRYLPLVLIAVGVAGCLFFVFNNGEESSRDSDRTAVSDSINALCAKASSLITEGNGENVMADVPGAAFIEAKMLLDSSRHIAARHGVDIHRIDSLDAVVNHCLSLTLTAIDARLEVVEGISAAVRPLIDRRAEIRSVLSAEATDSIN